MESEEVDEKKIGIALSGGGFRAAVFHLGVLKYLAVQGLLENIVHISSVSGGSIAMALIYKLSDNKFPSSKEYLNQILPQMEKYFVDIGLGRDALVKLLYPWNWKNMFSRANIIADTLFDKWDIKNTLQDLETYPIWEIGATTNETGKSWRFSQEKMGDYKFGFVEHPKFQISKAVAASAAFPGVIGRYSLDTSVYKWFQYKGWGDNSSQVNHKPLFEKVHLSDGGVYDNLATEPFIKYLGQKVHENINYWIVCDASKDLAIEKSVFVFRLYKRTRRLIDITIDQIRMLRIRALHSYLYSPNGRGLFLQIGYKNNKKKQEDYEFLTKENSDRAKDIGTSIFSMKKQQYDLLINHAFSVAKAHHISRG